MRELDAGEGKLCREEGRHVDGEEPERAGKEAATAALLSVATKKKTRARKHPKQTLQGLA